MISSHFDRSSEQDKPEDQPSATENDSSSPREERRYGPNKDMTLKEFQHHIDSKPRTAYVAGYQNISQEEFADNYIENLDHGIKRGDSFILSDEPGTSEMALEYFHEKKVPADKITVYHCTSLAASARTTELLVGDYKQCNVKTISGGEMERIKAMSKDSKYDILWLREQDKIKGVKTASNILDERYTGLAEIKRLRSEKGIRSFMKAYDEVK